VASTGVGSGFVSGIENRYGNTILLARVPNTKAGASAGRPAREGVTKAVESGGRKGVREAIIPATEVRRVGMVRARCAGSIGGRMVGSVMIVIVTGVRLVGMARARYAGNIVVRMVVSVMIVIVTEVRRVGRTVNVGRTFGTVTIGQSIRRVLTSRVLQAEDRRGGVIHRIRNRANARSRADRGRTGARIPAARAVDDRRGRVAIGRIVARTMMGRVLAGLQQELHGRLVARMTRNNRNVLSYQVGRDPLGATMAMDRAIGVRAVRG
jgi:hypothetical protein